MAPSSLIWLAPSKTSDNNDIDRTFANDSKTPTFSSGKILLDEFASDVQPSQPPPHPLKLCIASLGVIVSSIAIISSPITQLMITYTTVPSASNGTATIPSIQTFQLPYDITMYQGIMETVSRAAGTTLNDTFPSLAASCSAGNCTFPPIHTLGVCSAVANITEYLQITTIPNSDPDTWTHFTNGPEREPNITARRLSLADYCTAITPDPGFIHGCPAPLANTIAFGDNDDMVRSKIYSLPLISSSAYTRNAGPANTTTEAPRFFALELFWYACVQELQVSVREGVPSTRIISTSNRVDRSKTRGFNGASCRQLNMTNARTSCSVGPEELGPSTSCTEFATVLV
ncbi:hypothetical protein OQA88_2120 [Cercophora sp. LCS_1]